MKKLILIFAVLTSGLFQPVQAQPINDVGISLKPAIIEVAGTQTSSSTRTITIENTSDGPLALQLEPRSLFPVEDEIDKRRRSEFDASSWVQIDDVNLALAPHQQQTVDLTISIPAAANPGGHYALLGVRILNSQAGDSNTTIIPEVGVSLLITVPGDIQEKAQLVIDGLLPTRLTADSHQQLSFRINNIGNVHLLPAPRATIYKVGSNQPVQEFNFQPNIILPNTSKEFSMPWQADVAVGRYYAVVEATYGSASIPLASTHYDFRVIPAIWQFVAGALVAVAGIGFAISLAKKHGFKLQLPAFKKQLRYKQPVASDRDIPTEMLDDFNPVVLGFPWQPQIPEHPATEPTAPAAKKPVAPAKPKRQTQKPTVATFGKTSITQTGSSIIVREHSDEATSPVEKPAAKKIVVTIHDSTKPERKKITPQKSKT